MRLRIHVAALRVKFFDGRTPPTISPNRANRGRHPFRDLINSYKLLQAVRLNLFAALRQYPVVVGQAVVGILVAQLFDRTISYHLA